MADIIKVCALGGLDENGRDCYIVEINNDIFVLDCGTKLPNKDMPGVDYILPNTDYLIKNKNRIVAYFITHGHDENMSALKYFYSLAPAPVYVTQATKDVIEWQAHYTGIRTGFNYQIVGPNDMLNVRGHTVKLFQISHNAAYSFGVAIDSDQGYIVYTGDFIVDYSVKYPGYVFRMDALNEIVKKGTFLLMAESKMASHSGYCSPKHRIGILIEKYFKQERRIFIDSFWQNFFRIHEIIDLCKQYKKKLYCYNDFTKTVVMSYASFNPGLINNDFLLTKEELLRVRKQDVVVLMLGYGEELYDELRLLSSYQNEDKRIILDKDDVFINAALPTQTLEVAATRSVDSLYRTGCEVVWLKSKEITSMHARQDDLKFFLSLLKPKYYFPVRGSFVSMMDNAKMALSMGIGLTHMNVFVLDNGMQIDFSGVRPQIIPGERAGIVTDPVLVCGKGVSNVADAVCDDRRKLGVDGVVVVASTISLSEKRIVSGPDCQMRGFVYVKEAEPLLKSISNIYVDELNTALQMDKANLEQVKENIAERARRFIRRENGREPMILPIIIVNP